MSQPAVIAPKADQPETWCHLAPFGVYSYVVKRAGRPVLDQDGRPETGRQVLDTEALDRIAAAFDAEDPVLVDREHWSGQTGDSTAMGWVQAIERRGDGADRADGLWGRVRWTDLGRAHIENRRLRWLSPVWDTDEDGRPLRLLCVGLTNTARFKNDLSPVVNKADGESNHAQSAPDLDGGKENIMKEIAVKLGLPEDATPEQVAEAIDALVQFKTDAEAAQVENEAEAAYEEKKDQIENKDDFIALYKENPAAAKRFLGILAEPVRLPSETEKQDPVTNKAEARKPSFATRRDPVRNKLEVFEEMPEGPAKDRYQRENADELLQLQRSRNAD